MEITKFNVQNSEHSLPEVSYLKAGLMSPRDKENLESIKDMAGKAISEVNVSAEISPELSEEIERLDSAVSDQSERLTRLHSMTESQGYCGRVWDESNADPKAMTWCGNLDMLRNLPELLGLGCYLVQPDHSRRKLNPVNHYKFADDGTEAKLDGSMGHYQWGWNKVFYITTWHENNLFYEVISFEPVKSRKSYRIPVGSMSASGRAAYDAENEKLCSFINFEPNFRGGDRNESYDTDSIRTLLGKPITRMSTTEFMKAAHKVGEGWFAGSMRMSAVLKVLFDIIMGTRNCQAEYNPNKDSNGLYQGGLGSGVSYIFENGWDESVKFNNLNPFIPMDACIEYGDICGVSDEMIIEYKSINDENKITKYKIPIFFGLKNPYGHIYTVSEDEFINFIKITTPSNEETGMPELITRTHIHYARKKLFEDGYVYGNIDDNVMKLGEINNGNGYIHCLSYNNLECFPIVADGSDSTYHCDYFANDNDTRGSYRSIFRGGNFMEDTKNGLATFNSTDDLLYRRENRGATLVEFTEECPIEPVKQ